MIAWKATVLASELTILAAFGAILLRAEIRRRAAAADLVWFYGSGSFNIPQVSQRSALRDFGSLFMRRAFASARRTTPSSSAEGRRHEVARPEAGGVARLNRSSGAAARQCAANQSANGE